MCSSDLSMHSRFSIPMLRADRLLPSLRKTSFLNTYPENINNGGKRKVAIFIGCLGNYNYKDVGTGLLEILGIGRAWCRERVEIVVGCGECEKTV